MRLRALLPVLLLVASPVIASAASTPGAPGETGVWSSARKTGIGTAFEAYVDGKAAGHSRVWFSVADGLLTETMYGLIHEAQISAARLAVVTSAGLVVEGENTTSTTTYLYTDKAGRPLAPAYRLVTRDKAGTVEIEKRIFTDPDRNVLYMRVTVRPLKGAVTPYLIVDPHMANTATGDAGEATRAALGAHEGDTFLTVVPSRRFTAASVGFLGASDALTDLRSHGRISTIYADTGTATGSIRLAGQLSGATAKPVTTDIAIGFGRTALESHGAATASLKVGYKTVLAHYEGEGGQTGWATWLSSLKDLPRIAAQSTDGGKLAYASALALKVQEDKTHAGALIASLSNPWGDSVRADKSSTGYKAVWPRDFYQCAMALAALGDRQTPVAAFRYLKSVQVTASTSENSGATGWFQQKSHVDGQAEWIAVQLDQTAMPIMLGWKLWTLGLIDDAELKARYASTLKPAADFLVKGGHVALQTNQADIRPPYTQQERWEEQSGYSPSTTAAVVSGLTVAGEIAKAAGDDASATLYHQTADQYAVDIEKHMFTTHGAFGDGRYFLRIATQETADQFEAITPRNGLSGITTDKLVDAGFLELVRYGVRRADDPGVLASLKVLDDESREDDLRVRYSFRFKGDATVYPGFRRYGHDGYGEDARDGANYGAVNGAMSPGQRGRVWPLLTGERGHYALALASLSGKPDAHAINDIRNLYIRAMEHFANEGLMLPEQVHDGVGATLPSGATSGQGTGSATPLAWAHAEYIKLLRSLSDGQVWDLYAPVKTRYAR